MLRVSFFLKIKRKYGDAPWNSGIREKALRNLLSEALSSEDFQFYFMAFHKSSLK
jgi:hypothetical protein